MRTQFWTTIVCGSLCAAAPGAIAPSAEGVETKAKELRAYIQKEKKKFERRESQRKDIVGELDHLNSNQNKVRQKKAAIEAQHQELNMALDNLSIELEKQRKLTADQKQRLLALLKLVYRVQNEGIVRFLLTGDKLSNLSGRLRILLYGLRSHSQMARELELRKGRLKVAEEKVVDTKILLQKVLGELKVQDETLDGLLREKRGILRALNEKQSLYQNAVKEYQKVTKQLAALFDNFESQREPTVPKAFPSKKTLPLPVLMGKLTKPFGRSVNEKFHTEIFHKGIEIEATHNAPVTSILPGLVEYQGWVKGLGNVIIIHHGGGFYSLSAHLYETLKSKGDEIAQGETIGYVGDTGTDDKPSLYFEIRENGKAVDPLKYFSTNALTVLDSNQS